MGRTVNGGGDILARGGVKATFRQPNVTEEKYDEATQDFDLEKFLAKDSQKEASKAATQKERKRS